MENEISYKIIGATIGVHSALGGPGLLESIYESSLCYELRLTGMKLSLIINFGQDSVKDGVHRIVNGL